MDKKKYQKNQKNLPELPVKLGDKKALLTQYSSQINKHKQVLEEYSNKLGKWVEEFKKNQEPRVAQSPIVPTTQEIIPKKLKSKNMTRCSQTVENSIVEIIDIILEPVDAYLWGFNIDLPQKGDKFNSYVIEIIGWVLGKKSPAMKIEIVKDERVISQALIRKQRLGVAKHYQKLPKAKKCGFVAELGIAGMPQKTTADLTIRAVLKDKTIVPLASVKLQFHPPQALGVVYIAMGKKYIEEAKISAASLKAKMPNIPVTIFANQEVNEQEFDKSVVVNKSYYSFEDKVVYMYDSPYEYTLFLDTDTYICEDFSELFAILDNFDIAAVHAPTKIPGIVNGVPECYQQMNTGVILFKKSPEVKKFFEYWVKLYKSGEPDQPSFREALFNSQLRIATLTAEYNCRFPFPFFVCGTVKILHGRHPNLDDVAQKINSEKGLRVYKANYFKFE